MIALLALGLTACSAPERIPQRYAMVIGVKPDKLATYRALHADPWPGVLAQLDRSKIRNFSIWLTELRPAELYLFAYFEYTGEDFEADMAAMGDDEETRRWWKLTDPCQIPIPTAAKDQQWVMMEELFYHDARCPGAALMPAPPPFEGGEGDR